MRDTVKYFEPEKKVLFTPAREHLIAVATPQVFRREVYLAACAAAKSGPEATDETTICERIGVPVAYGSAGFQQYEADDGLRRQAGEGGLLPCGKRAEGASGMTGLRIGTGYDVHRLAEGRRLILGGVEIPFDRGAVAHSDGDVLLHAVCDALLGALALGDIGQHFPPSDPAYAGISSLLLLEKTAALAAARGYRVVNLDTTIIAQAPKLAPYIPAMREAIARVLGIEAAAVSVKATTEEKLGFTGRGEGIAAQAAVLLEKA